MSLTPNNLIEDAKLQAFPYLRDENVAPGALLRHLTTLDREVIGLLAQHAPERVSVQAADITIVEATNLTGYALNAAKHYSDWIYIDIDGHRTPIEIAPEGKKPAASPAGRVFGNSFFPIDPLDKGWDADFGARTWYIGDGDKIAYRYIAEPVRVTSMTQTLASPDEVESYFKEALVLQILLSCGHEVPAERIQNQQRTLTLAKQNTLLEIIKRAGVTSRTGE